MSDQMDKIQQELDALAKSLYLISPDSIRAMSTHETEDEIRAMQQRVDKLREMVKSASNA